MALVFHNIELHTYVHPSGIGGWIGTSTQTSPLRAEVGQAPLPSKRRRTEKGPPQPHRTTGVVGPVRLGAARVMQTRFGVLRLVHEFHKSAGLTMGHVRAIIMRVYVSA